MDKIEAVSYSDTEIVLKNTNDLEKVYNKFISQEDFILISEKENVKYSKIITADNFNSKVKDGSLLLRAEEKNVKR